jgi:hypothetical protein
LEQEAMQARIDARKADFNEVLILGSHVCVLVEA